MMTEKNDDNDEVGKVAITMCPDHQGRGQHDAYVSQGTAPYGATYIKDGDDDDHDDSFFFFLIQSKNSYGESYIKDEDDDANEDDVM